MWWPLVVFLSIVSMVIVWVSVGTHNDWAARWPIELFRGELIKPRYREIAHSGKGRMYQAVPVSKHECANGEWSPRGTIWICVCGRGFLRRRIENAHRSRRYYWRIRFFHVVKSYRVRQLKYMTEFNETSVEVA